MRALFRSTQPPAFIEKYAQAQRRAAISVPGNVADAEAAPRETARASIQFPDYPVVFVMTLHPIAAVSQRRGCEKISPRTCLAAVAAFAQGRIGAGDGVSY
jgi:hypothetical protein